MPQGRPVSGGDRLPHVDIEPRAPPGLDQLYALRCNQFPLPQEPEYLGLKELPQHATVPDEDRSPIPLGISSAPGENGVQMRMGKGSLAEILTGNDHARHISLAH
jgi:hypothetical protein